MTTAKTLNFGTQSRFMASKNFSGALNRKNREAKIKGLYFKFMQS